MGSRIMQGFSLSLEGNVFSIIFLRHQDYDYCTHFMDEGMRELKWAGGLSFSLT